MEDIVQNWIFGLGRICFNFYLNNLNLSENINHIPGGGNIAIVDQPFNRHGIRPRIDSGFIYEEAYVPIDYVVKTTPRTPNLEAIHESFGKSRSIQN